MKTVLDFRSDVPTFMATQNPNIRMHQVWWTALPSLPVDRLGVPYRRLKRQFADHTMNTWAEANGLVRPGSRGFYVEGREDHLVPAFFENFTLFPSPIWFEDLLRLADVRPLGTVRQLQWSYSYEEVLPGERRPRIADVVFQWMDDAGKGALIIEAKRPGIARTAISEKDEPSRGYYLKYGALRGIDRRHQALLVDVRDVNVVGNLGPAVLTWQDLCALAARRAGALEVPADVRALLLTRLASHVADLGLQTRKDDGLALGRRTYDELKSLSVPETVRAWLVGSETYTRARSGVLPEPPYEWLLAEPNAASWRSRKAQSTSERALPLWRF